MEIEISDSSIIYQTNSSNLSILNDKQLLNDKYRFLKDCLKNYYKSFHSPTSKKIIIKRHTNFVSELHSRLHDLLLQITYTPDAEDQRKLIENTYSWYTQRTGINKTQSPSLSNLSPTKQQPEVKSFKEIKIKKKKNEISFKNSLGYFPMKKYDKSKESLIEKIAERHKQLMEKEKIGFGSPIKPGLARNSKIDKSLQNFSNEVKAEDSTLDGSFSYKKKSSQTPEVAADSFNDGPLSSPSMDFRRVAHKFRMIKPVNLDREVDQVPFDLAEEVVKVKNVLAKNRLYIDVKTLENGLCVHQKVKLNTSSQKKLPSGGELLLRFPISTLTRSSTKARPKKT